MSHRICIAFLTCIAIVGNASCQTRDTNVGRADTFREASWTLSPTWTIDEGLDSPESAIYDAARDVIYVSNVSGYELNGKGYLSAISATGQVVSTVWLAGLNAPTGMAIRADTLYVADYNRLAEIDIPTRAIRKFYPAPERNPGLNDVALSPDGTLFVSASAISAIYTLANGELVNWIQSDQLKFANGLHANDSHVYVAGLYLRRITILNKMIEAIGDDEILEDLESIESDGFGGYFVTSIGEKPIMHISTGGKLTEVLSRSSYSADVDFVQHLGLLIVPSQGNSVVAFRAARSAD